MERTKSIQTNAQLERKIETLSTLVSRAQLGSRIGLQSYGGKRDMYEALGYMKTIAYDDYAARYIRQDIAKAIIDRPAKATWAGELKVQEAQTQEETTFEKAWIDLDDTLNLKDKFSRIDRLTGVGCYGILLFGLDDVRTMEDFAKPVKSGTRKLLYLKPCGEGAASILQYETDPTNPRYGKPLFYNITISDSTAGSTTAQVVNTTTLTTVKVHYTRILHVVDDVLENDIIGIPRLESVFNRLTDLEKIVGGDAEMFWRGARPGFQGKVDADYQMTPDSKKDLQDQIDEYENNLRRILVNEGVSLEALDQHISDPMSHVNVQISMISAVTGIPKRILTGSERGELSSNQDSQEYRTYVQTRRETFAETNIVKPFVNKCIELAIFPKPTTGKYSIVWSDLFARSEAEIVKIGLDRSAALKNYITTPMAEAVVPPDAFMEFFLGLSPDQIDIIQSMSESEMLREASVQYAEEMRPPPAPVIPSQGIGERGGTGTVKSARKRQANPLPARIQP